MCTSSGSTTNSKTSAALVLPLLKILGYFLAYQGSYRASNIACSLYPRGGAPCTYHNGPSNSRPNRHPSQIIRGASPSEGSSPPPNQILCCQCCRGHNHIWHSSDHSPPKPWFRIPLNSFAFMVFQANAMHLTQQASRITAQESPCSANEFPENHLDQKIPQTHRAREAKEFGIIITYNYNICPARYVMPTQHVKIASRS